MLIPGHAIAVFKCVYGVKPKACAVGGRIPSGAGID